MRPVSGLMWCGQRVGIGRAQLGELPPLQHDVDQLARVLGQVLARGQIVEQVGARLPLAGLGLAAAGQLQAVEQELAELLGRAQVELVPGKLVDLLLEPGDALGERRGEPRQDRLVDLDAGALHVAQDRHHRPLQRLVDGGHALGREPGLEHHPQAQRHVRVLGGVLGRLVERHLRKGLVGFLGAGRVLEHLREGHAGVPQVALGQRVQAVLAAPAVERVGEQHGVVERGEIDAVPAAAPGSRT